jgi:methylenetetrahydrofolate dehydrogenase (NADP+) / methenyltetrahydrofolate cyclohydrolase
MTLLIDGTAIARAIRDEIKTDTARLIQKTGITPGLATVLVGDDPASHAYVKSKRKACAEAGIASIHHELPASVSQTELLTLVQALAGDAAVHGILVQLPLPKHLDEAALLNAVPLSKDVDGFSPVNLGLLGVKGKQAPFAPCTPKGCIELLDRSGVQIAGKRAVVIGRSTIVGLPVAMLLLARDATVTICHSRTADLPAVVRDADIVIAAIGRAHFVTADMVKPGATVIDVGINRVDDPSSPKGSRLVGDVDYNAVAPIAGAITPVPGGVGPMTIAMLLKNTLIAAERQAAG